MSKSTSPGNAEVLRVIGETIRRTRRSRGLSMSIAHEIRARYHVKLDPSYLSRIERGKTEPPLRTLLAIADFFKLRPGRLLDQATRAEGADGGFLLGDAQLVDLFIRLRALVGDEKAREHLSELLAQMLRLAEDVRGGNGEAGEPRD